MLITKSELRVKLTLIFLKHLLKKYEAEPLTTELTNKLATTAAQQADVSLKNPAFNWLK